VAGKSTPSTRSRREARVGPLVASRFPSCFPEPRRAKTATLERPACSTSTESPCWGGDDFRWWAAILI
jgi:hypothetical protein